MRIAVGDLPRISVAHSYATFSSSACGTTALIAPISSARSRRTRGEKEDLARELLADLAGEVRAAVARVERADVGIRLLEFAVLERRDRQVAHDVQRVPAAGRPARDDRDDDLGHEADEPLHLEDVQAAGGSAADLALGYSYPSRPADALVAARAERPAAVFRARAVAGEQHDADARILARIIERAIQLVDGVRSERVAHLRPVERDARDSARDVVVVRDIRERVETIDLAPQLGVEKLGDDSHVTTLRPHVTRPRTR